LGVFGGVIIVVAEGADGHAGGGEGNVGCGISDFGCGRGRGSRRA
jgi:hypothetical protein